MEVLKVPPVLVSAWIREYRGSETYIKLDDVMTPGIRRTRSVQRICLGQPWMFQQQPFVKGARGWKLHGAPALCRQLLASNVNSGT